MLTGVNAATGTVLVIAGAVQKEFRSFREKTQKLQQTHQKLAHFNFKFDNITNDLKTSLLTVDLKPGR